jgi:hypothetical protein
MIEQRVEMDKLRGKGLRVVGKYCSSRSEYQ